MTEYCCTSTTPEICTILVDRIVKPVTESLLPFWKTALNTVRGKDEPLTPDENNYLETFIYLIIVQWVDGVCVNDKTTIEDIAISAADYFLFFINDFAFIYTNKLSYTIYAINKENFYNKTHELGFSKSNNGKTILGNFSMINNQIEEKILPKHHRLLKQPIGVQIDYQKIEYINNDIIKQHGQGCCGDAGLGTVTMTAKLAGTGTGVAGGAQGGGGTVTINAVSPSIKPATRTTQPAINLAAGFSESDPYGNLQTFGPNTGFAPSVSSNKSIQPMQASVGYCTFSGSLPAGVVTGTIA